MEEKKQQPHISTPWERNEVVYQIYPKSFFDSSGKKGSGDLRGITQKLDYIRDLGVNAIWLSPIFASPMKDNGYDVSDYYQINPLYGTLEDFEQLLAAVHEQGLKLMLDFVPNHTSFIHPWFLESASSKDNPKRDWYIWTDPKPDGSPPNNWISVAGGSAWEFHEKTGQYYLHSFLKEMPDLNYRNPDVVEAMKDVLRFWLNRGVDGFRMDVAYYLLKDNRFLDEPINPYYRPGIDHPNEYLTHLYSKDQPESLGIMKEFASVLAEFPNKFMVSETYVDIPKTVKIYETSEKGLHAPFNFSLIFAQWGAESYQRVIEEFAHALSLVNVDRAAPVYAIGNHDQSRIATRLKGEKQARVAAMLQLTLPGMSFIYYGDEIGMKDVAIPKGLNDTFEVSRDPQRSPMQWDDSPNAGFTGPEATPWLPVSPFYRTRNVEVQELDDRSVLHLYRRLIDVHNSPVFQKGRYDRVDVTNSNVLAFKRVYDQEEVVVLLNFSDGKQEIQLEGIKATLLYNTSLSIQSGNGYNLTSFSLSPHEGYVFLIERE